jgi:hypothetical protein
MLAETIMVVFLQLPIFARRHILLTRRREEERARRV